MSPKRSPLSFGSSTLLQSNRLRPLQTRGCLFKNSVLSIEVNYRCGLKYRLWRFHALRTCLFEPFSICGAQTAAVMCLFPVSLRYWVTFKQLGLYRMSRLSPGHWSPLLIPTDWLPSASVGQTSWHWNGYGVFISAESFPDSFEDLCKKRKKKNLNAPHSN